MAWTFCTSGAAIRKAGAGANSTITASGAALRQFSEQAEASINAETRKDWTSGYDNIKANFKDALQLAESSFIGMMIINYDMGGYTSRSEAQTMLDVLRDQYRGTISVLKDEKVKENM